MKYPAGSFCGASIVIKTAHDVRPLCSLEAGVPEERRLHVLDGIRGVAAIVVVIGHLPKIWIAENFSHFYLAVDLFFMLSGFVIAFAYEEKLKSGLSARRFMLIRYIRLYPLYIVGTLIGIMSAIITYAMGKGDLSFASLTTAIVTAVLMLPSPSFGDTDGLMPLNPPAWSLLFELIMNFGYALVLFRLATTTISLIVVSSAVVLIWIDLHLHSLHTGMSWSTALYGITRVIFPYCVGILLYRTTSKGQTSGVFAYAFPLVLLFALMGHGLRPEVTELVSLVFLFPFIIFGGAKIDASNSIGFHFLGKISYGLYVTSVPIITLLSRILHASHIDENFLWPWFGYIVIAVLVSFAAFLNTHFDVPARKYIRDWLIPTKTGRELS